MTDIGSRRAIEHRKNSGGGFEKYVSMVRSIMDVAMISKVFEMVVNFLVGCLVPLAMQLQIPGDGDYAAVVADQSEEDEKSDGLFPSISKSNMSAQGPEIPKLNTPQPCSTGLTTKLLPFKNDKGEIEWTFTDDIEPGTELDCFKMSSSTEEERNKTRNGPSEISNGEHSKHEVHLSPTTSNSSNNDSILSNEKAKKKDKDDTPMTTGSSPYMSSDQEDYKSKSDEDGEDKSYQCPHCDAVFKIRGYLTRHIKKHAINKAYSCPFHKFSIYIDENNITHKCHPTGGFSRRDTYKTHLKSRHFKYPKGTKTKDRSSTPGNCSMCGEYFQNSEIWCEIHIEGAECKFLPAGFKGKSIIKNRLKKQLSKQRAKKLDNQTIDSTKLFETPTSNHSNTPIQLDSNLMTYDYNTSNSPTFSISSGNLQASNPSVDNITPVSHLQTSNSPVYYNHLFQLPTPQSQSQSQPQSQLQQSYPMFEQFKPQSKQFQDHQMNMYEDYDDEFCLDVDQLNKSTLTNYNDLLGYLNPQGYSQPHQQHVHY